MTKFTNFCDEFELRKLSIIFLERLAWRELFLELLDKIRKLGFKNSWSSYFDLHEILQLIASETWNKNKDWTCSMVDSRILNHNQPDKFWTLFVTGIGCRLIDSFRNKSLINWVSWRISSNFNHRINFFIRPLIQCHRQNLNISKSCCSKKM